MSTTIKTWQIINDKLEEIKTNLAEQKRTELHDLEPWIESNPVILGTNIAIIGRQVRTKSGPLDILGIDNAGNLVVVEIKRDKLPREALAQAIDYASDVAGLSVEELDEICIKHRSKELQDLISEAFPDVDIENLNINGTQRIMLVGFSVDSALERMIEWLFDKYDMHINAIVLNYIRTSSGDEVIAKTSILSEEQEQEVVQKRKFTIPMSDDPGNYDDETLKKLLLEYLSIEQVSNRRVRDVLLPVLLKQKSITRDELMKKLLEYDPEIGASKVGFHMTIISRQLGMKKNEDLFIYFLRN